MDEETRFTSAMQQQDHSHGALRECDETAAEPPILSNTGGSKYTLTPYLHKIDSLYLNYEGTMHVPIYEELMRLKQLAQSPKRAERALAQYFVNDHCFRVNRKGTEHHPIILIDQAFRIKLHRMEGSSTPMAQAQIASAYLDAVGIVAAEADLAAVIKHLNFSDPVVAQIYRFDICTDFTTDYPMEQIDHEVLVTRARNLKRHTEIPIPTGFTLGKGDILCRAYNKTIQIKKLKKRPDSLLEKWGENGWDGKQTVWRLEFQLRESGPASFGINNFNELKHPLKQKRLWRSLTEDWVRIVTPIPQANKSRWPTEGIWTTIQDLAGDCLKLPRLKKYNKNAEPNELYMYRTGLAPMLMYMAVNNLEDFQEAMPLFIEQVDKFQRRFSPGNSLETYKNEKIAEYRMKFNRPANSNVQALEASNDN